VKEGTKKAPVIDTDAKGEARSDGYEDYSSLLPSEATGF
jgi:hypothetical protein